MITAVSLATLSSVLAVPKIGVGELIVFLAVCGLPGFGLAGLALFLFFLLRKKKDRDRS